MLTLFPFFSFRYGQLSGMVEPVAGLFGAIAVVVAEPILPYALAFAAGAMIYVVVDDIIPEAQMWSVMCFTSCHSSFLPSFLPCVLSFLPVSGMICAIVDDIIPEARMW